MFVGIKTCATRVALAWAAVFAACAFACALSVRPAYAAGGYTVSFDTSSCPKTLHIGDTFTVTQTISKDDASTFPLYALSMTVDYDSSALELVSCKTVERGDVTTVGGGITYNVFSRVIAGDVVKSGLPLYAATFKVVGNGAGSIQITRANMSNSTGKHRMPLEAYGLSVEAGKDKPFVSVRSEAASTKGDASAEDEREATIESVVKMVKDNPATALDANGSLSPDVLSGLYAAGMTKDDLKKLGFSDDELDRAEKGDTVSTSVGESVRKTTEKSSDESGDSASAGDAAPGEKAASESEADSKGEGSVSGGASSEADESGAPIVPIAVIIGSLVVLALAAVAWKRMGKKSAQ